METTRGASFAVVTAYSSSRRKGALELLREALREVRSRRHLILHLARADLKKKGTDTLFGNVWWILDPLLQMVIYSILVTIVFARSQPAYPLFVFAALLPWKWFSNSMNDAVIAVTVQDRLIKQVQFPKIVLPLAVTVGGIGQFAFGLIPLAALLVFFYPDRVSPQVVWLPVVAAVQFVFTVAMGLVLAAMNVFLRDTFNLSRHALRLWFYLSPALYGRETIERMAPNHPLVAKLFEANPFYVILESYRGPIYRNLPPDFAGLGVVLVGSVAFLLAAVLLFKRLEPNFAKVL